MTKYEFIEKIRKVVRDSSIEDMRHVLTKSVGRKPAKELVIASNWYNMLNDEAKDIVNRIIEMSIDNAVFGLLCVLDGVRVIEDPDTRGNLKLSYINNDEETSLNEFEDGDFLHEIYNS